VAIIAMTAIVGGSLLPWAVSSSDGVRRFERTDSAAALMPPTWAPHSISQQEQLDQLRERGPFFTTLGTDRLGRDVLARCVVGGLVSVGVGLSAACIAVLLGTAWGSLAGVKGGRTDAAMMRLVDVLYGLPAIMLVVLIAVAADGLAENMGGSGTRLREAINVGTLFVAIGAVSWLTVARVVRGQVLSLQARPAMEAARAIGVPPVRRFIRHLLPGLVGSIIVYATLTVPAAILSEAFLSFLGIGIREPLPSWGNLAADGLGELNIVHSRWWLLAWPCLCIAMTLVSLNALGERLRDRVDPRRQTVIREVAA
jgi:oligopeptide transport system permease protein